MDCNSEMQMQLLAISPIENYVTYSSNTYLINYFFGSASEYIDIDWIKAKSNKFQA